MSSCDNCDSHVSADYYRVRKGNDGDLHACPSCCDANTRPLQAAGLNPDWEVRSDPEGLVIPRGDD